MTQAQKRKSNEVFLANAAQKGRKETTEKALRNTNKYLPFIEAKKYEWTNINEAEAVRVHSSDMGKEIRSDPELKGRIMGSRWVLTDKDADLETQDESKRKRYFNLGRGMRMAKAR